MHFVGLNLQKKTQPLRLYLPSGSASISLLIMCSASASNIPVGGYVFRLKVLSVSITILKLQPSRPLGASCFQAWSAKHILAGKQSRNLQWRVKMLLPSWSVSNLRPQSAANGAALLGTSSSSIESNEKMKAAQWREAPNGHRWIDMCPQVITGVEQTERPLLNCCWQLEVRPCQE